MAVCFHLGGLAKLGFPQGFRGFAIIFLMMHGWGVGVAVSHFLQLLVGFYPIQLLHLPAGKVGREGELGPER